MQLQNNVRKRIVKLVSILPVHIVPQMTNVVNYYG